VHSTRYSYSDHTPSPDDGFRLNLLCVLIILLSLSLVLRLAYLQFSEYKRFATMSLKNQMTILPVAPTRGVIVDRKGVVLAENIPIYTLEIIPERIHSIDQTLLSLQQLLPTITDDDVKRFHLLRKRVRSYESIPLKLKLSSEEVAIFASQQYRYPGVNIKAQLMRHYPFSEKMAHLLGYVGRINLQELQQLDTKNYRATSMVGKTGIEKFYEDELHGQVGYQQVETNVSGRTLRVLRKQAPIPGIKLKLTIDAALQVAAYDAMAGRPGAVVAIDPRSGAIRALVSTPGFDPNIFTVGIAHKDYERLTTSPDKPLFNRAIRGLYPPASTVKPFVALAGLNKNVITAAFGIHDPGKFQMNGVKHVYHDWKRWGHGWVNMRRAIMVSCDTYFYQLGLKLGIGGIEDILVQFGFGQLTHIDLPDELPGLIPNPSWKMTQKHMRWYSGDTVISAIGQGFMIASPLQLANAVATMSMHGRRFRPHLLASRDNEWNKIADPTIPFEEYPVMIKNPTYWDVVIEAMQLVVTSQEGTGLYFGRHPGYTVGGKTGTAQVFSSGQYPAKNQADLPPLLRDHSWFIAFAPVENPKLAVAVIVEHDHAAASVARAVMDAYLGVK